MVVTSAPANEAELQLYRVMQRASLLAYYDTLLEMGLYLIITLFRYIPRYLKVIYMLVQVLLYLCIEFYPNLFQHEGVTNIRTFAYFRIHNSGPVFIHFYYHMAK